MYDEYDEDGESGGASVGRKLALGIGVVAMAAAGFFAFQAVTKGSGGDAVGAGVTSGASAPGAAPAATGADKAQTLSPAISEPSTSPGPSATDAETTTTSTTTVEATTVPAVPATTQPATTAPPAPAPPAAPTAVPYDTLPDGSPAWVIVLYGPDSITLSGAVPDQASKDRLGTLAVGNAKPGQAATVTNNLTINPAIPLGVGVRVVELTSSRFPDGSAVIVPEQAAELDRVVTIMNALPKITALVIGHADQRGSELTNFTISEQRADAVTTYLSSKGIAPSRLSSRAVGEADLLTLNNDTAALALNRRTEFVFFGLLIP